MNATCARCGDFTGGLVPGFDGASYCEACCVRVGGDGFARWLREHPRVELRPFQMPLPVRLLGFVRMAALVAPFALFLSLVLQLVAPGFDAVELRGVLLFFLGLFVLAIAVVLPVVLVEHSGARRTRVELDREAHAGHILMACPKLFPPDDLPPRYPSRWMPLAELEDGDVFLRAARQETQDGRRLGQVLALLGRMPPTSR